MAITRVPADGQIYNGDNPQIVRVARCTLAFSGGDVNTGAVQGTYGLFSVPAGCLVLGLMAVTTVAWTASVTITLGDGVAAAGFAASAKLAPTVAVATGILKNTAVITADAYAGGIIYLVADTIDAVVAGANPAVGTTEVFIQYIESYLAI